MFIALRSAAAAGGRVQPPLVLLPFQFLLEQLAGRVVGEGGHELNVGRDLVSGQRERAPVAHVGRAELGAGGAHDERLQLLAELRVVDPDHGRVVDLGVLEQPVFDLDRVDVLAAAQDQVPPPALQVKHPVGDTAVVAGGIPAILVKHGGGSGRIFPVAQEDRRRSQVDLPDLARAEHGAPFVADLYFHRGLSGSGAVGDADEQVPAGERAEPGALAHAVAASQPNVREALVQVPYQLRREGGPARAHADD